jgi:hypothetical protein
MAFYLSGFQGVFSNIRLLSKLNMVEGFLGIRILQKAQVVVNLHKHFLGSNDDKITHRMTFRKKSILIIFLLILLPALCQANPWLPEPGHSKFFSSIAMIDKESINRKKIREEIYLESQRMMYDLEEEKSEIVNRILLENRNATNNERRTLEQIDQDMKTLKLISIDQKAYQDDKIGNVSREYGINEKYSLGVNIGYRWSKFASHDIYCRSGKFISRSEKNTVTYGNNVDIFLKYKVFNNDNWIITLQPKLYMDKYGKSGNKLFQEIGLMVGYSRETITGATKFSEIGIFAGNSVNNKWNMEDSGSISFTKGIKFQSGIMLYNFLRYYTRKVDNKIYNKSLYEQISVAKETGFGRLKRNNFTVSAGYFFDQSLVDRNFKLSGPVFSLWFNI